MNNLTQRILTIVFAGGALVTGLYFSPWAFAAFMLLMATIGYHEYYGLTESLREKSAGLNRFIEFYEMSLCSLMFILPFGVMMDWWAWKWCILLVAFALFSFVLELRSESGKPFINISIKLIGAIYIGTGLALVNLPSFHGGDYQGFLLILLLLLIWVNDMGAYIFGRLFGKNPLFERISPKKTVEGFLGGILLEAILVLIIGMCTDYWSMGHWVALGLIASLFSTLGDLVESMLKRSLAIKDSGSLLPGHGGILDRFDAFFLAMPMMSIYYMLFIM